jgi:hypothetical protein
MSGRVLTVALQIAGAWTLMSLLMVGFRVLSLEFVRRFRSKLESAGPLARLSICPG